MPAPVAPFVAFLLGCLFAWPARRSLRRPGQGPLGAPLVLVTAFALLVFAPVVGYFMTVARDWSYCYLAPTSRIPAALDFAILLTSVAAVPVGFAAGVRVSSNIGLLKLAGVPATLVVVGLALALRRLTVYGTYAQFHDDFGTRPIAGSPAGYALIWMTAVTVGAAVWTLHHVRKLAQSAE